ncbi:flagella synthesis protein FlgN [Azoarcus sp. KH32C]|uniref:flagella synthesis protein FlgN n=1 Tax=Azoarcus sp. KH32C TaxID=748247 RepID=UPI00023864B9|nr:flagellar protein FlgN [Azoarcus sp. KH32C]BAL23625.1 putative chaperon of flagellar synthesis [Azoarcus sp. KH32C]
MTIQPEVQRIAQLIDTEATLLQGFVALLEREESLLIAGDADALLVLSQEKTERYHQLQRIHGDRALLLARLRKPHTDAAIREVCAPLPTTCSRWDQVLELARDAQRRNALNGNLITERLQHNQAALAVLLNATQRPQLYDAAGMTRATGIGRHLGSA